jgi:hypothetical protein
MTHGSWSGCWFADATRRIAVSEKRDRFSDTITDARRTKLPTWGRVRLPMDHEMPLVECRVIKSL